MVSLLVLACALAYAAASNPLMPDDYTCTDESKTPVQNIIPVSNGCSKVRRPTVVSASSVLDHTNI